MTWIGIFALVIAGLALLPVLLMARVVELRTRPRHSGRIFESGYFTGGHDSLSTLRSARASYVRDHHVLEGNAGRQHTELEDPSGITYHAEEANPYEYTIKKQAGAFKQHAIDMGGYSEVSLMLYDRLGNSFTVYRRLSLN